MGLFATVWKYRTITDHVVCGQRFIIEEAFNEQGKGMGYEYSVDGVDVTPMVFDRALAVAKMAMEQEQKIPRKRAA